MILEKLFMHWRESRGEKVLYITAVIKFACLLILTALVFSAVMESIDAERVRHLAIFVLASTVGALLMGGLVD